MGSSFCRGHTQLSSAALVATVELITFMDLEVPTSRVAALVGIHDAPNGAAVASVM